MADAKPAVADTTEAQIAVHWKAVDSRLWCGL
jgi:hypothetical protein